MLGYAKRVLRDVLPLRALNAARHVYYAAFRAGLAVKCEYSDLLASPESTIPPALLRFRVSETTDLSVFLNVGERTAHDLESNLAGIGLTLKNCDTVLDFGCGAGRTLRWLIQQFPRVRFYGTDVDRQAIAWTKDHL